MYFVGRQWIWLTILKIIQNNLSHGHSNIPFTDDLPPSSPPSPSPSDGRSVTPVEELPPYILSFPLSPCEGRAPWMPTSLSRLGSHHSNSEDCLPVSEPAISSAGSSTSTSHIASPGICDDPNASDAITDANNGRSSQSRSTSPSPSGSTTMSGNVVQNNDTDPGCGASVEHVPDVDQLVDDYNTSIGSRTNPAEDISTSEVSSRSTLQGSVKRRRLILRVNSPTPDKLLPRSKRRRRPARLTIKRRTDVRIFCTHACTACKLIGYRHGKSSSWREHVRDRSLHRHCSVGCPGWPSLLGIHGSSVSSLVSPSQRLRATLVLDPAHSATLNNARKMLGWYEVKASMNDVAFLRDRTCQGYAHELITMTSDPLQVPRFLVCEPVSQVIERQSTY